MELKIDLSKKYAVALEGGGAKGAYEIGAWKALDEIGVQYNAVSGSSVGALNGALMSMRELDKAIELWENIRFSQVMDVDDEVMTRIFERDLRNIGLRSVVKKMVDIVKDRGFDVEPLRELLSEVVDEERVRASDVALYIVAFSLSDRKMLDIDVKELQKGQLCDMLMASAYLPGFRLERLGGKLYADGGVQDLVPINSLVSRGYKDIIVVRIYGVGIEKKVKIPDDTKIITIAPTSKLGNVLNFSSEQSRRDIKLGYFDAKRALYGLEGDTYYIDRTWSEKEAYERLCLLIKRLSPDGSSDISLRRLHEELLPGMAAEARVKEGGDYYDVLIGYMEQRAKKLDISPFEIMTDFEFFRRVFPGS